MTSALVPTGMYLIEFYVSLADSTEFSSDGLGFHLFTTAISNSSNEVLAFSPQYSTTMSIGETQNWVRVFDTVTVADAFAYLTIGNFYDDAATSVVSNSTASFEPGTYGAYYFIDDVRVERVFTDPTSSLDELKGMNVRVFPNPALDEIHIEFREKKTSVEIELMDARGNMVWSTIENFKKRVIDLKSLDDGIYFIRIQSETATYSERIVKM